MKPLYQPDRGHFVWLNFSPTEGTEQAGQRPALVLSPKNFNIATSLAVVVPVTNQIKGSPFEVVLPKGVGVTGAVLSNQIRTVDWIARRAAFKSEANMDILCEVLGRIEAILSIDC